MVGVTSGHLCQRHVDVLVLTKFNTCPGVTGKYSGTFAGISAAALLAVTTAVESMVTRKSSSFEVSINVIIVMISYDSKRPLHSPDVNRPKC
jgi:hypothetical protein